MTKLVILHTYDEDLNVDVYSFRYERKYLVTKESKYDGIEEYIKEALIKLTIQDFTNIDLENVVIIDWTK